MSLDSAGAESARQYLAHRGLLPNTIPPTIRFHPRLRHTDGDGNISEFPAIVGKVSAADAKGTGLLRIYLDSKGHKAPVDNPKKALGSILGGAIHLAEASEELHLCEGLETSLAIYQTLHKPTWCAVSANGLRKIEIPPTVKKVFIWGDRDQSNTGQRASNDLAERLTREGRQAFALIPPTSILDGSKSRDWLDEFNELGSLSIIEAYGVSTIAEPNLSKERIWPAPVDEKALIGLAGETVRLIEPHTESDPAGVLLQFLVAFGNAIGRSGYYQVEGDRHYPNLFLVLVGKSSRARKGTSWGRIRSLFSFAEPEWLEKCLKNGLSSGEGLIFNVRDPLLDEKDEIRDPGVTDKRLLVQEGEFASVLKNIRREGNTLSPTIRNAWDDGNLSNLVKKDPNKASGSHISIIGHITRDELLRCMTETETANGFGNRFLWACVRKSKELPMGGELSEQDLESLGLRIRDALVFAGENKNRIFWSEEARSLWPNIYTELCAEKVGILGSLTSRAEAQVVRIALVYALLDKASEISCAHLLAAVAVWEYCEASCLYVFGDSLGHPEADQIIRALTTKQDGMTRTELNKLFQGHKATKEIERAVDFLVQRSLATWRSVPENGRHHQRLFPL